MPIIYQPDHGMICCHCGAYDGIYAGYRLIATVCRDCRRDLHEWAESFGGEPEERIAARLREWAGEGHLWRLPGRDAPHPDWPAELVARFAQRSELEVP